MFCFQAKKNCILFVAIKKVQSDTVTTVVGVLDFNIIVCIVFLQN